MLSPKTKGTKSILVQSFLFQLMCSAPRTYSSHTLRLFSELMMRTAFPRKCNSQEVLYRHKTDSSAKHRKAFKSEQAFWLELMTNQLMTNQNLLIKALFALYNFTYSVKPTYVLCIFARLTQENCLPNQIITDTKTSHFVCRTQVLAIYSEGCKHYT